MSCKSGANSATKITAGVNIGRKFFSVLGLVFLHCPPVNSMSADNIYWLPRATVPNRFWIWVNLHSCQNAFFDVVFTFSDAAKVRHFDVFTGWSQIFTVPTSSIYIKACIRVKSSVQTPEHNSFLVMFEISTNAASSWGKRRIGKIVSRVFSITISWEWGTLSITVEGKIST